MARGFEVDRVAFLTEEQKSLIHEGSCRVLEEVGMAITSPRAIALFEEAGATHEDGRVTLPRSVVEETVARSAGRIELAAKNPDNTIVIDTDARPRVHFGTGGQALHVLRCENGRFVKKDADTRDLVDILRICEGLDNVDFITRPVEPDVPKDDIDLKKTEIFLEHTTRHMNLANLVVRENLPAILEKVGDPSLVSFVACVAVSPLSMAGETVEKFLDMVEADVPMAISSCPQGGTTAPLSEIGELIQLNAEILSAVVLANIARPGARVLYRGIPITANLFVDGSPRWCQPESIRRLALIADMTYFYGLPCCGTAAVSDEPEPNAQALSEKVLGWTFEAAAGAHFINSAVGMLDQIMTVCPAQYIIDDIGIQCVRDCLAASGTGDLKKTACTAAAEFLGQFGVDTGGGFAEEMAARADYILAGREAYTAAAIDAQVDLIRRAMQSVSSSTEFIIGASDGLRDGWLYTGDRIEGDLALDDIIARRDGLLAG